MRQYYFTLNLSRINLYTYSLNYSIHTNQIPIHIISAYHFYYKQK